MAKKSRAGGSDFKDDVQSDFSDEVQGDFSDEYGDSFSEDYPDEFYDDRQDWFSDEAHGGFCDDYAQPEPDDTAEQAAPTSIKIKVSDDGGETWYSYNLDVTRGLENTGLRPGQLLIMNSERYEVYADDFGDVWMRKKKEPTKKSAAKAGKRK